ncbi:SLAM family member 9-like [Pelmatolapia mariae]|uniref:SLAM family member 9-like n=1 Tax=Pelmatolapia mariae TaxID=158779 RepID=UPI002FE600A7
MVLGTISFCQELTHLRFGDTVRLVPHKLSERVYSVVWKYNKNLLAEWVEGSIPLTYYNKFRGRTMLNTETGTLVFQNGTLSDTGLYSVELNNQVQDMKYWISIIENVPKPTARVTPVLCNLTLANCTVVCEGDVSKADPVEYLWTLDDGEWRHGDREMEISNKRYLWNVKNITCRMRNPVSERDSDSVSNPFYQETGMGLYVALGIAIGLVALLAPVLTSMCLRCQKTKPSVSML